MAVTLKPITKDNWEDCICLKVHPEQEKFVASNLYSIAEAQFYPGCAPLAISDEDTLVGFIMYLPDLDCQVPGAYSICRLMVDRHHQGRGYGRRALQIAIDRLQQIPDCQVIRISYVPENTVGAKLYQSLGFVPTGEVEHGEIVAQMSAANRSVRPNN